jgi:RNA-directed DNA polymerase
LSSFFSRSDYEKEALSMGHSRQFVEATLQYADNLIDKELPVLYSLKHLSETIGVPFKDLKEIISLRDRYYGNFKIMKKNGGFRDIRCPNDKLKGIQKWILKSIVSKIPPHDNCIGFKKEDYIVKNASMHLEQEALLKIDLYSFFDTVTEKKFIKSLKISVIYPILR